MTRLRSIPDILRRLRAQALGQLPRYRLGGLTGTPCESRMPPSSFGPRAEPGRTGRADQPVGRAGRALDDVLPGRAVPGDVPALRPAVSRAHGPRATPETSATVTSMRGESNVEPTDGRTAREVSDGKTNQFIVGARALPG